MWPFKNAFNKRTKQSINAPKYLQNCNFNAIEKGKKNLSSKITSRNLIQMRKLIRSSFTKWPSLIIVKGKLRQLRRHIYIMFFFHYNHYNSENGSKFKYLDVSSVSASMYL